MRRTTLAAALAELAQVDVLHAALGPEPREQVGDLGPPEREDAERALGEVAEHGVEDLHAREVAPVEILQHEQERRRTRLGVEELLEREPHLVAHQGRVGARRGELDALGALEARARDLAEEPRHALRVAGRDVPRDAGAELVLLDLGTLAVADARLAADHLREHAERRPGAHRIALGGPHLEAPLRRAAGDLLREPALADAGAADDDHGAGARLRRALVQHGFEVRDLVIAPDARRGLAEHGARELPGVALAGQHEAGGVALDLEAGAEQAREDIVEPDARERRVEQREGAIAQLAALVGDRGRAPPGHRGDGRAAQRASDGDRAAGGPRSLVRRRASRGERDHHRPRAEIVDGAVVPLRGGGERRPARIGAAHRERARQRHGRGGRRFEARLGGAHRRRGLTRRRAHAGEPRGHRAHDVELARGERRAARRRHRSSGVAQVADGCELARGCGAVLGAAFGRAGQHARHERVERRRDAVAQRGDARRVLEHDLEQRRVHLGARERRAPGEAVKEHAPERVDVGAGVDRADPAGLLGCHVERRPHDHAGRGERILAVVLGDPEVDELGLLDRSVDQHDVRGLDVAVDDAPAVRRPERLGDAPRERDALGDRQPVAPEALGEALAFEPLDREVRLSLGPDAVREVPHDGRVIEIHQHARLAGEALGVLRLADEVGPEHLHRGEAGGGDIARAIDRPHPAGSREAVDLEATADHVARLHARSPRAAAIGARV